MSDKSLNGNLGKCYKSDFGTSYLLGVTSYNDTTTNIYHLHQNIFLKLIGLVFKRTYIL